MDHKILFIFLVITTATSGAKKSFDGYKVYKVTPTTEKQVAVLDNVQKIGVAEFWEDFSYINVTSKVMVSEEMENIFLSQMKYADIETVVVFQNLQEVIDNQFKRATRTSRWGTESLLSMSWDRYYTFEEINDWLDELETNYEEVQAVIWGRSNQDREIKGLIINYHPERENKLIGVIEGTIHAREWISPATVTWIIKEFLTSDDPDIRALAENIEWHILPISNPDGYSYTFTDNRLWRKNRNILYSTNCSETVGDDMSNGVDLNRNFGFNWMVIGASDDPCTNTFAGSSPFSEPETRAIANYVQGLAIEGKIIYYLAFHSYSQLVLIPYSHLASTDGFHEVDNYADLYEISIRAADRLSQRFGTYYRVGISQETLNYPMSGTSFDWVKNNLEVPITFLIELRDQGEYGFLLPPEQIIPNNLEIMDFLKEMDEVTRTHGYYTTPSTASSIICSIGVIVTGVFFSLMN